jgi:hypothetical protein
MSADRFVPESLQCFLRIFNLCQEDHGSNDIRLVGSLFVK